MSSSSTHGGTGLRGKLSAFQVLRAQALVAIAVEDLCQAVRAGTRAPILPLTRAVQEFVRLPPRMRLLQLAAVATESSAVAPVQRLTRLALLGGLVARRLGLGAGLARDIAVATALSAIGRLAADELLYADAATCTAADTHVESLRWILGASGAVSGAALRVLAAQGQVAHVARRSGHPIARLVAVIDRYERFRRAPPQGLGLRADEAMRKLSTEPDLDSTAVEALGATIGLYPIGCPVRLSSGQIGIVVDVPGDCTKLRQPRVMVVQGDDDREVIDPTAAGLSVTEALDPTQLKVDLKDFLFA